MHLQTRRARARALPSPWSPEQRHHGPSSTHEGHADAVNGKPRLERLDDDHGGQGGWWRHSRRPVGRRGGFRCTRGAPRVQVACQPDDLNVKVRVEEGGERPLGRLMGAGAGARRSSAVHHVGSAASGRRRDRDRRAGRVHRNPARPASARNARRSRRRGPRCPRWWVGAGRRSGAALARPCTRLRRGSGCGSADSGSAHC